MKMALRPPVSTCHRGSALISIKSDFLTPATVDSMAGYVKRQVYARKSEKSPQSISCSAPKVVRDRSLVRHVVKQNKLRFVVKLRTLLLSKPKHYMPLRILSDCRSYLSIPKSHSIVSVIQRYPTIFELFYVPCPPTLVDANNTYSQLCVRLTPAAESLSMHEANLQSMASLSLVNKLRKLLMLSPHRRLLLSKLFHIGPDLGLPSNLMARLCDEHPELLKTVVTSYGRALELVSWDPDLANPLPKIRVQTDELIVGRPSKFNLMKLRKGLNVKRSHHEFLMKLENLADICPYKTSPEEFPKQSMEAEKRACAVVREILGMTVEKRTLIDHLKLLRKDFGLPNKLRGMLVRHPELFYVSLKGHRDSVFLVEAYDEHGDLLLKDETLATRDCLLELVRAGKNIRQQKGLTLGDDDTLRNDLPVAIVDREIETYDVGQKDGLEDLFEWDESDFNTSEEETDEELDRPVSTNRRHIFWSSDYVHSVNATGGRNSEVW